MAVDNKIPHSAPGIAGFDQETWGNNQPWQYSDTPALVTQTISVTASGADVVIDFLDVIAKDGDAAVYNATPSADTANFIAATTITVVDGSTKEVPVFKAGHFDMGALNWDASYDTDAKKAAAFEGSVSPTLFVSKSKFGSDAIY